jgi:Domain of unknown function (DUF5753)
MRRQQVLTRADPPPLTLWWIMDEAVLRRQIGGRETMHAQLLRLIERTARRSANSGTMPSRTWATPGSRPKPSPWPATSPSGRYTGCSPARAAPSVDGSASSGCAGAGTTSPTRGWATSPSPRSPPAGGSAARRTSPARSRPGTASRPPASALSACPEGARTRRAATDESGAAAPSHSSRATSTARPRRKRCTRRSSRRSPPSGPRTCRRTRRRRGERERSAARGRPGRPGIQGGWCAPCGSARRHGRCAIRGRPEAAGARLPSGPREPRHPARRGSRASARRPGRQAAAPARSGNLCDAPHPSSPSGAGCVPQIRLSCRARRTASPRCFAASLR